MNHENKRHSKELQQVIKENIYFERQSSNLLCGMHAVNNFLGSQKYSVEDMNQICYSLAQGKKVMNPHKHWIMAGDFDVNVLMIALAKENYEANWHDQRKDFTFQVMNKVDGFLVNIESSKGFLSSVGFGCCYSGRHWLTVKKIQTKIDQSIKEVYVIFDSLESGYRIVTEKDLVAYMKTIQSQNGQILLIQKQIPSTIQKKLD